MDHQWMLKSFHKNFMGDLYTGWQLIIPGLIDQNLTSLKLGQPHICAS